MTKNILETRIDLLSKSAWNYNDIMSYYPKIKSRPTAIKIKDRAIKEFNGGVKYGSIYATVESVLNLFGTNREEEMKKLKLLANNEDLIIASEKINFEEDII